MFSVASSFLGAGLGWKGVSKGGTAAGQGVRGTADAATNGNGSDGRSAVTDAHRDRGRALRLGLLYSTGQGGAPLDYVSAHMLFNLAAMRGSDEAKAYRRELSGEMDPADIAEAQRAAREWLSR